MEKKFYITKEEYDIVKKTWAKGNHDASWHVVYNLLRSKDVSLGFSKKNNNIQGNDPWYAFNSALSLAISRSSLKNPYPNNEKFPSSYIRGEEMLKARKEFFKSVFGIDIPETLNENLMTHGKKA